jgi:enterochelin esterase-like enzyme
MKKTLINFFFFFTFIALFIPMNAQAFSDENTKKLQWITDKVEDPNVKFMTFYSQAAQTKVSYHVYTPPSYNQSDNKRFPVLYWLHGTGGGTNHIRPAAEMFNQAMIKNKIPEMIVIFVNGLPGRLWTDSKNGLTPIETVFIRDLIPYIDKTMRTIPKKNGRILEGFSMGGYGAARIGFKHTELFGGISILAAGPLDPDFHGPRADGNPLRDKILEIVCDGDINYFRSTHPWTIAESYAETIRKSGTIIRQAVGDKDFTLYLSRRFHEHLDHLKISHEFIVIKNVDHNALKLMSMLNNGEFYQKSISER